MITALFNSIKRQKKTIRCELIKSDKFALVNIDHFDQHLEILKIKPTLIRILDGHTI